MVNVPDIVKNCQNSPNELSTKIPKLAKVSKVVNIVKKNVKLVQKNVKMVNNCQL